MSKVTVAATQMSCSWDIDQNLKNAEQLVEDAAAKGAQIVLLQELFEAPYFCKDQKSEYFKLAHEYGKSELFERFQALAKKLNVVLPLSYFELSGQTYFNSLAVIDADGRLLENYRKSHIPDGPGYQEKYYFSPGDTGFKVWQTQYAPIGVAICWDQWFPEAARSMALQGAEILFYPTAIGSEPHDEHLDSRDHWQRTMQGHAAANCTPLVSSNRIGKEEGDSCAITFYGSSFITDNTGAKIEEADRSERAILTATFDLERFREQRTAWGLFRDRRPDMYQRLTRL